MKWKLWALKVLKDKVKDFNLIFYKNYYIIFIESKKERKYIDVQNYLAKDDI